GPSATAGDQATGRVRGLDCPNSLWTRSSAIVPSRRPSSWQRARRGRTTTCRSAPALAARWTGGRPPHGQGNPPESPDRGQRQASGLRVAYRVSCGRSGLSSVSIFGMPNTKSIGEVSEAIILAEFLKAGFPVLLPFGDNQRYDMVVEVGGRFLRVQCKTAS